MQTNLNGCEVEVNKPTSRKTNKGLDKLMWAITGPIVETPSAAASGDRPPEKVANRIQMERLVTVARDTEMATETEAMWYICTTSLDAPLSRDWCDIYMYLTRKFLLATTKAKEIPNLAIGEEPLPDFLQDQIELNEMLETDLKRLREWIYKKSFEAVRGKTKMMDKAKTEEKPNVVEIKKEVQEVQQTLGVV